MYVIRNLVVKNNLRVIKFSFVFNATFSRDGLILSVRRYQTVQEKQKTNQVQKYHNILLKSIVFNIFLNFNFIAVW